MRSLKDIRTFIEDKQTQEISTIKAYRNQDMLTATRQARYCLGLQSTRSVQNFLDIMEKERASIAMQLEADEINHGDASELYDALTLIITYAEEGMLFDVYRFDPPIERVTIGLSRQQAFEATITMNSEAGYSHQKISKFSSQTGPYRYLRQGSEVELLIGQLRQIGE